MDGNYKEESTLFAECLFNYVLPRRLWLYIPLLPNARTLCTASDSFCTEEIAKAVLFTLHCSQQKFRSKLRKCCLKRLQTFNNFCSYIFGICFKLFIKHRRDIFQSVLLMSAFVLEASAFCYERASWEITTHASEIWFETFRLEFSSEFFSNGGWLAFQSYAKPFADVYNNVRELLALDINVFFEDWFGNYINIRDFNFRNRSLSSVLYVPRDNETWAITSTEKFFELNLRALNKDYEALLISNVLRGGKEKCSSWRFKYQIIQMKSLKIKSNIVTPEEQKQRKKKPSLDCINEKLTSDEVIGSDAKDKVDGIDLPTEEPSKSNNALGRALIVLETDESTPESPSITSEAIDSDQKEISINTVLETDESITEFRSVNSKAVDSGEMKIISYTQQLQIDIPPQAEYNSAYGTELQLHIPLEIEDRSAYALEGWGVTTDYPQLQGPNYFSDYDLIYPSVPYERGSYDFHPAGEPNSYERGSYDFHPAGEPNFYQALNSNAQYELLMVHPNTHVRSMEMTGLEQEQPLDYSSKY